MDQNNLSKWLERLQQESWNLELLISGFSIFLLFQAGSIIESTQQTMLMDYGQSNTIVGFIIFLLIVAEMASVILLINLIAHVVLRGFWIGTIGLRSVQKRIDFDALNYSTFFKEKLKIKVGGLDQLVIRLDTICSVIFSFTFLIIFMLISLFMYTLFLSSILLLFNSIAANAEGILSDVINVLFFIIFLPVILISLIYFIDTISLGFFKKFKRISRWYYPVYRFLGFITLSFIYRSIYYSFINRFSKTKIRLFLIPYLLIISLSPFFGFDYALFYPDNSEEVELDSNTYNDQRNPDAHIDKASIPSQIVKDDWLPLFIRYKVDDNENILAQCPDYKPSKKGGFVSGIFFNEEGDFSMSSPMTEEKDPKKLLSCLTGFYKVYLNDSLQNQKDFYYYKHPNKSEKGIYTIMDINQLPVGKHVLKITKKSENDDGNLTEQNYITIPFWKQ